MGATRQTCRCRPGPTRSRSRPRTVRATPGRSPGAPSWRSSLPAIRPNLAGVAAPRRRDPAGRRRVYCDFMSDSERYTIDEARVVSEIIDGEAIIVNLANGYYYSLDPPAAEIWGWLEAGWSPLWRLAPGLR